MNMQTDYKNKVVVITGGSSGIGLAIASEFRKQQSHVVIVARNQEKLQEATGILAQISSSSELMAITGDVSDRVRMEEVIEEVTGLFGRLDVLVNNAGYMSCGRFTDQSAETIERCLLVNYQGAVNASKAAWPWLKQSKGQLAFVSSVAGYLGLIGYSSYAPTKFALAGLAECLRMEGAGEGIRVSIIYPPDTDTPLLQYERKHTLPESRALSENIKAISAEKVAGKLVSGLTKNKFEIYCDFNSRFLRGIKNNLPSLFYYMSMQIVKKAAKKEDRIPAPVE
jgi:3-dehydrosphinganine reductase